MSKDKKFLDEKHRWIATGGDGSLSSMILGRWVWSSNGKTFNTLIDLYSNKTCEFWNAHKKPHTSFVHEFGKDHCTWSFDEANKQLRYHFPAFMREHMKKTFAVHPEAMTAWMTRDVKLLDDPKVADPLWKAGQMEAMLIGDWGWATDGKNVKNTLELKSDNTCVFKDEQKNPLTTEWCKWSYNADSN
jgi:hypothetical protein